MFGGLLHFLGNIDILLGDSGQYSGEFAGNVIKLVWMVGLGYDMIKGKYCLKDGHF